MSDEPKPGSKHLRLSVEAEEEGRRVDRILADRLAEQGISRSRIRSFFEEGLVRIAGEIPKPSHKPAAGDAIELELPPPPVPEPLPEPHALVIPYEDDDIVVVDKPAGMVVHPTYGHETGTLVNALLAHTPLSSIGAPKRPGIVHRIDKGTSGLLVVAKNDRVHLALKESFKNREVEKEYLALVFGRLKERTGMVDLPLGRSRRDRTKMSTSGLNLREALTEYELIEEIGGVVSYLRVQIRTGRTHQIRVHMAALSHPLVGDAKYGGDRWKGLDSRRLRDMVSKLGRPFLHAHRLAFQHPSQGTRQEVVSPLPEDLSEFLDRIRESV